MTRRRCQTKIDIQALAVASIVFVFIHSVKDAKEDAFASIGACRAVASEGWVIRGLII
jgi:hypothetical protein